MRTPVIPMPSDLALLEKLLSERRADLRRRYANAAKVVGRFHDRDRRTDVATEHDRYLDEAFG